MRDKDGIGRDTLREGVYIRTNAIRSRFSPFGLDGPRNLPSDDRLRCCSPYTNWNQHGTAVSYFKMRITTELDYNDCLENICIERKCKRMVWDEKMNKNYYIVAVSRDIDSKLKY